MTKTGGKIFARDLRSVCVRTRYVVYLMISGSLAVTGQSRYDPFTGGFEIGSGYGTVIDFNLENNNLHREYLLEKLIWLPFQVSLFSDKYLDPNRYVELGVSFARKSSSYVRRKYDMNGHSGSGLPVLELYCIDLPVKYYSNAYLKGNSYIFGGMIPSWLMHPSQSSSNTYEDIPEECYRNFFLSVCGGFCLDHKRSRIKLQAELATTSIVSAYYRKIPPEERAYGGRIYPFGILVCFARVFR